MTCLQKVGEDSGDEDEEEGQRHELKDLPWVVRHNPGEKETQYADQERRSVSEVASTRPCEESDQRYREQDDEGRAIFTEARKKLREGAWHRESSGCDIKPACVTKCLDEGSELKTVCRDQEEVRDQA